MKKLIIYCMVSVLGIGTMMAQTPSDKVNENFSEQEIAWAKERTQQLDNEVSLTQQQKEEVMKINLRYARDYQKLKAEGASDERLDAYRDKTFDDRIKSYGEVLNDKQRETLKTNHDKFFDKEKTTDREERKAELKEKADDKGMNKQDVKDKKEEQQMKDDKKDEKKDDMKEKAADKDKTKEDVKDKKEKKDGE